MLYEPNKTLAKSCQRLFDTTDPSRRGEIGEILLHAVCRQEYGTIPFVARLFYKMRTNDSVTSIDVAHLVFNSQRRKVDIWIGEAKLYSSLDKAKIAALESIKPLWNTSFLNEMKALVGPKIEKGTPNEQELFWLFEDSTSLDEIIDSIVIPICISCSYPSTKNEARRTKDYIAGIEHELIRLREYFRDRIPTNVRFVVIFVPLSSKLSLESHVNKRVRSYL